MTEEERELLRQIAERNEHMHRAIFEPQPGSSRPPLIEELHLVANAYARASWLTRGLFWAIPAVAAVALGIDKLLGYFK